MLASWECDWHWNAPKECCNAFLQLCDGSNSIDRMDGDQTDQGVATTTSQ